MTLLLVTGASGAGKSTVRQGVSAELSPEVECIELGDVVDVPTFPDIAWRQRATETAVQRALVLQSDGRHLLLSGDPVAAGEVLGSSVGDAAWRRRGVPASRRPQRPGRPA